MLYSIILDERISAADLFFNGVEVKEVDSHKHLGLTLDPKLTVISMKRSQKLERLLELLGIFHLSPLLRP